MLRSTALLLEHGLGRPDEAAELVRAIEAAIQSAPTPDLGGSASTSDFGSAVRAQLRIDDPAIASYRGSDGSRA
jgi:isocitrate/isopropylmalate dehydrogenase